MTSKEKYAKDFEIQYSIRRIRYMVDYLTEGIQATPITKGVFGYKCNQNIIERDMLLLENLKGIQKHLHELCELSDGLELDYIEEG